METRKKPTSQASGGDKNALRDYCNAKNRSRSYYNMASQFYEYIQKEIEILVDNPANTLRSAQALLGVRIDPRNPSRNPPDQATRVSNWLKHPNAELLKHLAAFLSRDDEGKIQDDLQSEILLELISTNKSNQIARAPILDSMVGDWVTYYVECFEGDTYFVEHLVTFSYNASGELEGIGTAKCNGGTKEMREERWYDLQSFAPELIIGKSRVVGEIVTTDSDPAGQSRVVPWSEPLGCGTFTARVVLGEKMDGYTAWYDADQTIVQTSRFFGYKRGRSQSNVLEDRCKEMIAAEIKAYAERMHRPHSRF